MSDLTNADKLLRLSCLCKESYERKIENPNQIQIVYKANSDIAYISFDENLNSLVVAVRGSDDRKDWLSNFMVRSVKTKFGRCHRGFYGSANDLCSNMIDDLVEIESFNYQNIIVTGHSRGGAIAYVLANLLADKGINVCECVTFGAPRAFKRSHKPAFDGLNLRVVNQFDIVPSSVPALFGYHHKGKKIAFDDEFKPGNHDIDDYIENIKKFK